MLLRGVTSEDTVGGTNVGALKSLDPHVRPLRGRFRDADLAGDHEAPVALSGAYEWGLSVRPLVRHSDYHGFLRSMLKAVD